MEFNLLVQDVDRMGSNVNILIAIKREDHPRYELRLLRIVCIGSRHYYNQNSLFIQVSKRQELMIDNNMKIELNNLGQVPVNTLFCLITEAVEQKKSYVR